MSLAELNLTGDWKGIFSYPRAMPPNQFDAKLIDHSGVLAGETFERGNTPRSQGQPLHAMIDGLRDGHSVHFVKRYDEFRRIGTPVYYDGTVRADGDEISGTWEIRGHWSGTFLMIRAQPKAASVEHKTAETVR